jgi:hypothetical protein
MMTIFVRMVVLFAVAVPLAACELMGDIFQAGFWAGFIIVLLVIALVAWFMQRHKS